MVQYKGHLPVAQLDSASDSDSEGQRFESARVGQQYPPTLRGGIYFISHCDEGAIFHLKSERVYDIIKIERRC